MHKRSTKQQGYVLILGLVVMAVLMTMSGVVWGYTTQQVKSSRIAVAKTQAWHLAEAGFDKALNELNTNSSFTGEANIELNEGTYTTTVSTIDSSNKLITATGYIPDSTNPTAEVTIKAQVSIDLSTVAFNFGVQVGEGGLSMGNNSQINGNVYSNGNLTGSGVITGSATVAGGGSPTLDQQCTTNSGTFSFNTTSKNDAAQRFTPAVSGSLTRVSLYIRKNGSPSNATVRILTHNSTPNNPTRTVVGGTGTINSANVTGSYGWLDITFSSNPTLTAGTNYWLAVDSTGSTTNYYSIATDSNDSCSNGTSKYTSNWNTSNPSYTANNVDFNFRTYMGGIATYLQGLTVNGTARANTMTSCTVGGNAYYDTTNTCSVGGTSYSGTTDSPQQSMPISQAQIDEWKDIAEDGGTIAGNYSVSGTETIGPKKIDGDLTITNGAILYLTGPIWVNGNINISNNASARVDSSLGASGTVLLADYPTNQATGGTFTVSNNSILSGNGQTGSYLLAISTNTSTSAMSIANNAAGAIYYAHNGTVSVSNNAGGSQITGYAIAMSNNSTVTYSTGLQSATFSSGPGGSWAIVAGSYRILD